MVTSFSGGGSRDTRREPQPVDKQQVNFITCGCEPSAPFIVIYITWKRKDKIQSLILHLYGLEIFSFFYRKNISYIYVSIRKLRVCRYTTRCYIIALETPPTIHLYFAVIHWKVNLPLNYIHVIDSRSWKCLPILHRGSDTRANRPPFAIIYAIHFSIYLKSIFTKQTTSTSSNELFKSTTWKKHWL